MTPSKPLSALQSWSSIARWTLLGTLGCILVSVMVNAFMFDDLGPQALQRSILSATVLPVLLGMPLFFYMSMRVRGLAITNLRLGLMARTDSLTSCLNRGAFTARVNTQLARTDLNPSGALLMIDADNFKAINDLFGHHAGDEALTIIARSIRSVLRRGEWVGRMGGEEFAVYLPGVDRRGAEMVAERIRRSINLAVFSPDARRRELSVSIGGAVFEGATSFSDLFRIADQRLYSAKQKGRNRVAVVHATDYPEVALSKAG